MSERLETVDFYMKAKYEFDRAKTAFDLVKEQLKEFGTFSEGGVIVDVSVIKKETLSLKDLKDKHPELIKSLRDSGLIKESVSERMTVKVIDNEER